MLTETAEHSRQLLFLSCLCFVVLVRGEITRRFKPQTKEEYRDIRYDLTMERVGHLGDGPSVGNVSETTAVLLLYCFSVYAAVVVLYSYRVQQ